MSSNPIPVSPSSAPFEPTTTPVIERANRLISVRSNPGFLDILRISQEIVESATAILVQYPGWDPQQIMVLKVRAQAAREHHDLLIGKIQEAIRAGIEEGNAQSSVLPAKTPEDAVDQGDYVRQQMLSQFEEQDLRSAGSY